MKKISFIILMIGSSLIGNQNSHTPNVSDFNLKAKLHNCVTYSSLLGSVELLRRIASSQIMQTNTISPKLQNKRIKRYAAGISLLLHRCNKNEIKSILLKNKTDSKLVSIEGVPLLTIGDMVEVGYDVVHNHMRDYQEKWEKNEKLSLSSVVLKAYIKKKFFDVLCVIAPYCYAQLPDSVTQNDWIKNSEDFFKAYGPTTAHVLSDAAIEGLWKFNGLFGSMSSYVRK